MRWIAALVLGVAAGGLHYGYVQALEASASGGERVDILVAREKMSEGQKLESEKVATRSVPDAYVDERVVKADEIGEIEGLAMAVTVRAGQAIQWTDFGERDDPEQEDLSALVEPGHRAMAIPVDASLSMGGMLSPGHRVDVLGTFKKGKSSRTEKVTVTLLQNVMVLATGRNLASGEKRYSTVTMSVGLEEAELLAFASSQGSLSLVLRGRQDLEVVRDVPEKGMEDVWEAERRNALQDKARPERRAIERLRAR